MQPTINMNIKYFLIKLIRFMQNKLYRNVHSFQTNDRSSFTGSTFECMVKIIKAYFRGNAILYGFTQPLPQLNSRKKGQIYSVSERNFFVTGTYLKEQEYYDQRPLGSTSNKALPGVTGVPCTHISAPESQQVVEPC